MCLTIKIPMVGAGKINHNSDASGGILAMCGPAPGTVISDQPGHRATNNATDERLLRIFADQATC